MDFDFGGFITDVAGELGISDQGDLAAVAAKGLSDGAARIKDSASQQAPNLPTVAPTAYVTSQAGNLKVLGFSLTANQLTALKLGAAVVGGLLVYKMIARKR